MKGALIDLAPEQMLMIGGTLILVAFVVGFFLKYQTCMSDFAKYLIPLLIFASGVGFCFWGAVLICDPQLTTLGSDAADQTCSWINNSTTSILICQR